MVKSIVSFLRLPYSLHVHMYLDDWLFRHHHRELLIELAIKIVAFLQSLRWEVNLKKLSLTPSRSYEYLSLRFRSDLGVVHLADHLLDKLQRDLTVLSNQIHITPRELQAFLGLINFLAPLVDLGHLHMCPIQFWLSAHWNHSLSSIDLPLPATLKLREALKVW